MKIGYDLYSFDKDDLYIFFKNVKINHIKVLHLRYIDDMYYCYCPTYQRYKIHSMEPVLIYHQTIGLLKYIFFLSHHYLNIVGVICFLVGILLSSHFIFDVQITGTVPEVNQQMMMDLKNENISMGYPLLSYENLNDILMKFKENYKDKVEYMSIYKMGSVIHIEYTKRKQDQIEVDDYACLYAKSDGMISSFDVKSGAIKVKKNDYVKKGDLLVDNTIISTQNVTQLIPVEGHVYAYTFHQYEASIEDVNQDRGEAFYQLLLMVRNQLPVNVVIDKENVLQMTKSRSRIILKVHYTLIEDIAIKGEGNEGSH